MLGVAPIEIVWLVAAIVVAGIVTGVLAGLFGIGGGAVIVPVLYEVFRGLGVAEALRLQLCIGTSLAIIVPTVLRAYRAHRAREAALAAALHAWAVPSVCGVAADGYRRRIARDDGADPVPRANPPRGRDLGRARRADHDRGDDRLCDCG